MRILYRLLVAALLVTALPGPAAQAMDGKEVADKLITVVVIGGATVAGIPPPSPEQVAFMKEMVGCIIDGTAVADCGKQSLIKAVLKDVPAIGQQLAACAISGRNVGGCAVDQLLEQVPEQARPLVKCVAEGNDVAGCGAQFAAGIVDQKTKEYTREALDALNKLKTGEGMPDAMKNILAGAEGIREGDYGKIVYGFGTEAAKLVITIVVEAILGPAVAPIAGPIISEIVQNRADLIRDLMEGLKDVDPVKLGKVLVEFYLTTYVEAACALIPDGGFKEATCGNIAKAISAVAGAAGDVLSAVLGFLGDVGEGIIKGFVAAVEAVGDGLASVACWIGFDTCDDKKDPKVCGGWDAWAANNVLTCLTTAADNRSVGGAMYDKCAANFSQCYDNAMASQACHSMLDKFGGMVNQLSGDVTQAAEAYGNSAAAFAAANPLYACDPNSWSTSYAGSLGNEFINNCASSIGKKMPWSKNKCPVASGARMWGRVARRWRAARHGTRARRRWTNASTASWKPCGRSVSGRRTCRRQKIVASPRTTPPMAKPIN